MTNSATLYGNIPVVGILKSRATPGKQVFTGVFKVQNPMKIFELSFNGLYLNEYIGPAIINGREQKVRADARFKQQGDSIVIECSGPPEIID